MPDFNATHEFDCDETTFWEKIMLSDDFNHALYMETLKFPGWKVLERKVDGDKVTRHIKIDPPMTGLPGPMQKALGDKFSYTEDGTYDRAKQRYTFKVTPSALTDKTTISGEIWTEKKGDDKIVRHAKVHVEVKVFMIGKMIEEKVMSDLSGTYETGATFTRIYLKKNL